MLKSLAPNERVVLRFIVDGYTNKEISEKLLVSELIIDSIMHTIFTKLNVRNCFQAAAKVVADENCNEL